MTTISIENFRAMGANATIAKFSLIRSFAEFLSAADLQMEASTLREILLTNGIGPYVPHHNPVERPRGINELIQCAQRYYLRDGRNLVVAKQIWNSFLIDEEDEFDD